VLVKVIVYPYLQKIYSSRKIAKALREDINFMWLSAMNQPDFRAINGFRSERVKDVIDKFWGSMLTILVDTNGYLTKVKIYECEDCSECPYSEKCKKGKGNRTVQRNDKLEYYKQKAREKLNSEKGIELRKRRRVDIEPVLADSKWNQEYRRFRLRGLKKVNIEFGLLAIVHNIKKIAEVNRERKEKNEASQVKLKLKNEIVRSSSFCWLKAA